MPTVVGTASDGLAAIVTIVTICYLSMLLVLAGRVHISRRSSWGAYIIFCLHSAFCVVSQAAVGCR